MSFYNDASLVVIPSGFKTSKVYAEKPTDGSGDLAFTRTGDTATRVNSAGLIEKVRTNLLTYSQDVTNAAWTKSATTASANTTTAPDGTTTADTITETATSAQHAFFNSFTTGASIATFSVYLKANGRNFATIYPQGSSMAGYATVNLSDGTINSTGGSTFLRAAIESAGNGWYRIQLALTTTANSLACVVYLSNTLGGISPTYLGDGTSGVFVWGAQLETGDVATPYIPTTTAAVSVGPVANVPRLDYLGSTCPRLLLEPQRTNLYTFSEQLNQWTASSATVTANYAVSPDGYTNAERVQFAAGGLLYNGTTGSAGENTLSVYAKATNGTSAKFRFFANGNLTNSSDQTATGQWQRFTFTYTYSALTAGLKVATTGADDILFWGFQHEIGAYATSYIPTLAASATRGADACSKTSASALIGATAGTMFIEVENNPSAYLFNAPANVIFASINSGDYQNNFHFVTDNTKIYAFCNAIGGTLQAAIGSTLPTTATLKMAVTYTTSAIKFFLNGALVGTDTSFTLPSGMSRIDVGFMGGQPDSQRMRGRTNQFLLFKTALTDAQCIELTTL